VYQTARDYTNPTVIFSIGAYGNSGITYDAANRSLWISNWRDNTVTDYSLSGTLLSSSFYSVNPQALALDPADQTLWLVNGYNGLLAQYSTAGVLLSTGPYVGYAYGAEFDLAPTTPEPGTLILFSSGILGLAGVLRRKINL
jgi:DNA-binding beta-propeller fold protein YncE